MLHQHEETHLCDYLVNGFLLCSIIDLMSLLQRLCHHLPFGLALLLQNPLELFLSQKSALQSPNSNLLFSITNPWTKMRRETQEYTPSPMIDKGCLLLPPRTCAQQQTFSHFNTGGF
jgi:hypothetical protein